MENVSIVLPTYNGEKYIKKQLDSIINQTYTDWHLYIRDDGSKDKTREIVKTYADRFPQKITVIKDHKGNLNVSANVFEILRFVKGKYIMLSDQDDVWFKRKVELQFKAIRQLERRYPGKAVLLCADAVVTDKNLNVLYSSLFRCAFYDIRCSNFSNLLQRNIVQGASSIFNYRLLIEMQKAMEMGNTNIIMHDYWLALVASAQGKVQMMKKPLMYYRQHDENLVGALNYRKSFHFDMIKEWLYLVRNKRIIKEFKRVYGQSLEKENLEIIRVLLHDKNYRQHYIKEKKYIYDPLYIRVAKTIYGIN